MSKKNNVEKEEAFKSGQRMGVLFTSIVVAFTLAGGFAGYTIRGAVEDNKEPETEISSTSDSLSAESKRELVQNDEKKLEIVDSIKAELDYLKDKNICLTVTTGDGEMDYDGYLYNTSGECIQQSADNSLTVVYTNDNHNFRADTSEETISADTSIDILSTCENLLNTAGNLEEGYSFYTMQDGEVSDSETGEAVNIKEYIINVKGTEACKKLYNSVSDEYATDFVNALISYVNTSVRNSDESKADFDWNPEFEFGFIFSDDHQLGMYCNCVIEGQYESNWLCEGYFETDEWKLSDKWYSVNWEDGSESNLESMVDILDETIIDVYTILNGAPPATSEESTEDTGEAETTENVE